MIKKGISFVIAAAMAFMCFAGMGPAVASAAETDGLDIKVVITGPGLGNDDDYTEQSLANEVAFTLDELKVIADADSDSPADNRYYYSALNTENNTSIYKIEGVKIEHLLTMAGVTDLDNEVFNVIASDYYNVCFDPDKTGYRERTGSNTTQGLTKERYYYPEIGILGELFDNAGLKHVSDLTNEQVQQIEAGKMSVPTTIAWAQAGVREVSDAEHIKEPEPYDNDNIRLIVGALSAKEYNNPLWNGDISKLIIVVGEEEDAIEINGQRYTRGEFLARKPVISSYTYQTQNGVETKYAKGIKVSNFIGQFTDDDIIEFTSANTNKTVPFTKTKKEILDGNYMLAYETGDSADTLEPIYEEDDEIKGIFTLYGNDIKPLTFINNVTVIAAPEAPQSFSAKRASSTSIKLSWDAVYGAKGYKVYRSAAEEGTYEEIANLEGTDSVTFTDKGIATGDKYFYKVSAYDLLEDVPHEGELTEAVSAEASPLTPSNFKAARSSYNSIKLTWSKVSGADGYYIYRYNSSKKGYYLYKTIKSGATVSYTNTGLTTGKTYYYKIKSYANGNNGTVSSSASSSKSAYPYLTKPSVSLKAGSKKITVKWNKISGASGYKVYRATSKNGKYTCVKTVKSGKTVSFVNKSLKKGKTYYYKVRAYRSVSSNLKYSSYSTVKYTRAK